MHGKITSALSALSEATDTLIFFLFWKVAWFFCRFTVMCHDKRPCGEKILGLEPGPSSDVAYEVFKTAWECPYCQAEGFFKPQRRIKNMGA